MINLHNDTKKKAVLDALSLILQAKQGPIKTYGGSSGGRGDAGGADGSSDSVDDEHRQNTEKHDGSSHGKGGMRLKMPKDAEVIDAQKQEEEEREKEGKPQESDLERKARLDRIKDSVEDQEKLQKEIDELKTDIALKNAAEEDEKLRIKAVKDAEARKWHGTTGLMNIQVFEDELKKAIGRQVKEISKTEDSYSKLNPTYARSGALMPGQAKREKRQIPLLNVYFDLSGSLSASAIENGKQTIASLSRLKRQHKVNYNLYYFAERVSDDPKKVGGGTTAFPDILRHVKETHATNVIIYTDSDFDRQTHFNTISPLTVHGCVWWMWARGDRAERAFRYLQSIKKGRTFQYYL